VVRLVQYIVLAAWAKMNEAVLGEDAEVHCEPRGPSDGQIVAKVGAMVQWRLQQGMRFTIEGSRWILRALLHGRAFIYRPWEQRTVTGRNGEPEIVYDGPEGYALPPEDVILPADRKATSVHNTQWAGIRKYYSPQQLLNGERVMMLGEGARPKFFGIVENWDEIYRKAQDVRAISSESTAEAMAIDYDSRSQGVEYDGARNSRAEQLRVIEWYGKWRLPLAEGDNPGIDDWERRDLNEVDVLVRVLEDCNYRVIGFERLHDLYPGMECPRPIDEIKVLDTGEAWPMGLGKILLEHEDAITQLVRDWFTGYAYAAVPSGWYDPAIGNPMDAVKVEAGVWNPAINPRQNLYQLETRFDAAGAQALLNFAKSMVELITGYSDMTLGRSADRPNAPKTAAGQLALLESGNARIRSLDLAFIRAHLSRFLSNLWELECAFGSEQVFFRVTEGNPRGILDAKDGWAPMTADERGGRYDFALKFATSSYSKAAAQERALQLYQLDMANPLVAMNPRALWHVADRVHKALGDHSFGQIVPMPPEMDLPTPPDVEWTEALQGRKDLRVHPMDHDQLHLREHEKQLQMSVTAQFGRDQEAEIQLVGHIMEHQAALVRKEQMRQAAMAAAVASAALAQSGAPPQQSGGSADDGPASTSQPGTASSLETSNGLPPQSQAVINRVEGATSIE
jgi:hypothetical protein